MRKAFTCPAAGEKGKTRMGEPSKRTCRLAGIACAIAVGLTGCEGGESACELANNQLCDLACECTDGAECVISSGGLTVHHPDEMDCREFWVELGCNSEGSARVDYSECSTALESATCVDADGVSALEFPQACGEQSSR